MFITGVRMLRKLPIGMSDFDAFITEILAHPDVPTQDRDSIIFSVAGVILHSDKAVDEMDLNELVRVLRSGAAKQVAHAAFTEVKTRHNALAAEAAQKAKDEASNAEQQGTTETTKTVEVQA